MPLELVGAMYWPTVGGGKGVEYPVQTDIANYTIYSLKTCFFYNSTFITTGKFEFFGGKPPYGLIKVFKIFSYLEVLPHDLL